MAIVQIADFGRDKEGVYTYRIHGDKKDLEFLIEELRNTDYKFLGNQEPEIVKTVTKTYTILLKIYIEKEVNKWRF